MSLYSTDLDMAFDNLVGGGAVTTITFKRGCRVAGGELRHLAGSPGGGGGIRSCHTLIRVHTV